MKFKIGDSVIAKISISGFVKDKVYEIVDIDNRYDQQYITIHNEDAFKKEISAEHFKLAHLSKDGKLVNRKWVYFWWTFTHGMLAYVSYVCANAIGTFVDFNAIVDMWFLVFSTVQLVASIVYLWRLVEETTA